MCSDLLLRQELSGGERGEESGGCGEAALGLAYTHGKEAKYLHIEIQGSFTNGASLPETQHVPDQALLTLVHYLLPKIQAYYTSESERPKEAVPEQKTSIA